VDPIYLVPAVRAKQYDGTNAEEISAWAGLEVAEVTEQMLQLWVAPGEKTYIMPGYWVLATASDPPVYGGVMPDGEVRARHVRHPGPVTPLPTLPLPGSDVPPAAEPGDGPVTP
jgi:hypothetical protein